MPRRLPEGRPLRDWGIHVSVLPWPTLRFERAGAQLYVLLSMEDDGETNQLGILQPAEL